MWFVLLLLCTKSITIFEFGLKHAKGYPSLEYSFICFCFFRNLCLFVVKVYNITKIDKDSTICSYFFFFLVQFPWKWKDQFSQEIITLTWGAITHHPYVRILKQYVFEITTVWCKNCLIFFKSLSEFIYCPKKFLEVEKHMKNCTSNCSWTLSLNKIQYFKNLRHCFITTFLLFETHLFPIIYCSWLLR